MPLTPRFSLKQTPTHVFVEISVPSFRLSAGEDGGMEVLLMGDHNSEFHFYAKPYLLKLNFFPNRFLDQEAKIEGGESGVGTAKYDPSEQTVVVPLRKQPKDGDDENHWSDLDLTARMLEAREVPKKWLHAVVDESTTVGEDIDDSFADPLHSNDEPVDSNPLLIRKSGDGYGFDSMFRNIFTDYCRSGLAEEMLELSKRGIDPENSTMEERRDARIEHEIENFDFDRYLADLELPESDDYLYPMVKDYTPWWRQRQEHPEDSLSAITPSIVEKISKLSIRDKANEEGTGLTSTSIFFSQDEQLLLASIPYPLLPKRTLCTDESLITNKHKQQKLWCGVFELLLAYIYDHLTTMGDPTVESSWTISILSCGLSWLDSSPTQSLATTLHTFLRRILVYPYWRNIDDFGKTIVQESLFLMKTHRVKGMTKALLQIRSILDKSEIHYMGNKLLIDPYLFWIQNLPESQDFGLDWVIHELQSMFDEESSMLSSQLSKVEGSLKIDVLMNEYFGTDDESDEDDDDDDDDDDESENEQSTSTQSDSESISSENGVENRNENESRSSPPSIQLLDDEIGNNSELNRITQRSMLHCIDTNETNYESNGACLVTEVEDEDKNSSQRPLIQEI